MFVIKDHSNVIRVSLMRHYFEGAMRQTEAFKSVCLDATTAADGTLEYASEQTQALWVGWALGMRCAERIERQILASCFA